MWRFVSRRWPAADPTGLCVEEARRSRGSPPRDAICQQVMDKCWNPARRAFTAHPDTEVQALPAFVALAVTAAHLAVALSA